MSTIKSLKGEITIPGDKSISHRAVMFGSIAKGTTIVRDFLMGADCLGTIDCFRKMGVNIEIDNKYNIDKDKIKQTLDILNSEEITPPKPATFVF